MSLDKNYQGVDANLETSLEEYGFVARPITIDYDDEYFVIYKMMYNQYGSGHIRESELDAIVKGTEWADEDDVNSMLETVGSTKEEWFDLPFSAKFSDLVSYWGTENIMGTDYYPNDKKWAFEEIGLESDDEEYAKGGGVKLPENAKIRINWVDVSVYKDSYEEGETDNVNNYDMVGIKGSMVSPKELVDFLAKNIYTSEDVADYVLIDNNIHTSVLQDADGNEASEKEKEEWKKGNLELFSANYVINVSVISEINADSEMLSSLTGINVYKQGGSVKYAKGGGVEANFLQATNLDKKGAESLAETLKKYNNKVRVEKGEDGLYKVYTSSLSGDKYAKGGGVDIPLKISIDTHYYYTTEFSEKEVVFDFDKMEKEFESEMKKIGSNIKCNIKSDGKFISLNKIPKKINVKVYTYEDENGKTLIDEVSMCQDLEVHLLNYDKSVSVSCQEIKDNYSNRGGVNDNDNLEKLWIGYASAVLFAENDSDTEEPLDSNYSISDFDEETVKSSKDLIRKFYFENKKAIEDSGMDLDTIGNDIWYTRAGHGAGFFDHNLDKDIEDKLTKGAKALGELPTVETYDGKISVRGGKIFANGGGVKNKKKELYEFYDEVTEKTLLVDAYSEKEAEEKISKINFNDFEDWDNINYKKVENINDIDLDFDYTIETYKKGKKTVKIFYDKKGTIEYIFDEKGNLLKEFSFDKNSKYIFNEEENRGYYADEDSFAKGGGVDYYNGMKKEDIISKTIVYDNPDTLDRYTVFTPDGSVFGMSENAKGFNQYVGEDSEIQKGKHLGKKLKYVPTGIEWAILDRMKEEYANGGEIVTLWKIPVEEGTYKVLTPVLLKKGTKRAIKKFLSENINNKDIYDGRSGVQEWLENTTAEEVEKHNRKSFSNGGGVDDALNKNKIFNEFMLEWMIPNKESNTFISKSLKELIEYVSNNNIKNYTIKGWGNNKWETLISTNNSFEKSGGVDDALNKNKIFNEFMLEWMIPNKESNTFISKSLKELLEYVSNNNIKNYTIKGWGNNKWETLISTNNSFEKGGGVDDADWIEESLIDLQNEVDMDDLVVENSNNNHYTASNGDAEFEVFKTEDDARERAIERFKEDLEENPEYFNRTWIMNYIDGKDFFERVFNEWNESYVNDIESEDSDKYANRLIEEMVGNGIISSEEAKEDDFDAEDYKDSFVELLTNNQIEEGYDGLQNYIDNFGEEQAFKVVVDNNLIDIDRASESAVDTDGIGHFLSSYDGQQIDLSNGHVAYRTN